MALTQTVDASVDIEGADLIPTSIDVEVTATTTGNAAILKGLMDDPSDLQREQNVEVSVNGDHIFDGSLKYATQGFDGEITIEAYGVFTDFHNQVVDLDMEEDTKVQITDIIVNLLGDSIGSENVFRSNPHSLSSGQAFVAMEDSFPNDVPVGRISVGANSRDNALTDVLSSLTEKIAGVMWVDSRNVLRIEGAPQYSSWEAAYITDSSVGSDVNTESNVKKVLVYGDSKAVGGNAAESYVHAKLSPRATSDRDIPTHIMQKFQSEDALTRTLYEQNVFTQREADNIAATKSVSQVASSNSGSLTFVGTTNPEPWDTITVPELDRLPLAEGRYTVKNVKHVITPRDGWTTKVDLVPAVSDVADSVSSSGDAAQAIADLFLSKESDEGQLNPTE